jgi:MFS family permease
MRSKTAAKDSVYANDEDDEQDDETTSLTARADAGSAARSDDDGGDGESGAVTPLPTKVMFALVATAITEGFQMNVIWSFLPFMVEDLGHPGPSEQLGLWTGLMASSFFGGQIFASLIWPPLSDRIGRRKCLLFGQGTLTLCMLGFGFSRSYWPALAYRVVAGLLQGNQAIRKALLADITDKTNQAKAFSWMPFAWGLSSIVAPLVGGFLSRPCVNYPGLWLTADPSALLCVFPYALPCLVMSAIATASIICGFFWLPEEGKVTWCGAGLAVLAAPCRACQRSKRGGHATGEGDMEGMEIEGPPPPSFWRILR